MISFYFTTSMVIVVVFIFPIFIRLQNCILKMFFNSYSQFHHPKFMLSTVLQFQMLLLKNKQEIMLIKMTTMPHFVLKVLLLVTNHKMEPPLHSSE